MSDDNNDNTYSRRTMFAVSVLLLVGVVVPVILLVTLPWEGASSVGETVGGLAGAAALLLLAWQVFLQRQDIATTHKEMQDSREVTEKLVELQRVQLQAQWETGLTIAWVAERDGETGLVKDLEGVRLKRGESLYFQFLIQRKGKGEVRLKTLEVNTPITEAIPPPAFEFPMGLGEKDRFMAWTDQQFPSLTFVLPAAGANIINDPSLHVLMTVRVDQQSDPADWQAFQRAGFSIYWYANVESGSIELASTLSAPDARQRFSLPEGED